MEYSEKRNTFALARELDHILSHVGFYGGNIPSVFPPALAAADGLSSNAQQRVNSCVPDARTPPASRQWLADDYPDLAACERLDWLCVNGAVTVASAGVDRPTVVHSFASQLSKLELVTTELLYRCRITRICKKWPPLGNSNVTNLTGTQWSKGENIGRALVLLYCPMDLQRRTNTLDAHTRTE